MKLPPLFTVTLPLPPSINAMYIKGKILSPAARAFDREARAALRAQLKRTPWPGGHEWYAAVYWFWFDDNKQFLASDWDNPIKRPQDRLCEALGFNDKLIRDGRGIKAGIAPVVGYVAIEVFPFMEDGG